MDQFASLFTNASSLFQQDKNLSQIYKKSKGTLNPSARRFSVLWQARHRDSNAPPAGYRLKGIVLLVLEQLQLNPSDRSEEFRTAGTYFYSLSMPFSCFNSKKALCGGFSFDSHSANDE